MKSIAKVELTDTFNGEANYSWIRRWEFDCKGMSDYQIMRKVKKLIGWNGVQTKKDEYFDSWRIIQSGLNIVCIVYFNESWEL